MCLYSLLDTLPSREQRAESREQRAESREQRAESREQRAESREQRDEKDRELENNSAGIPYYRITVSDFG